MADRARMTRVLMCQLDEQFTYLDEALGRLDFEGAPPEEFRIFCDSTGAVNIFGFPQKSDYKGIKIIMVREYPQRVCQVIRSLDFITED